MIYRLFRRERTTHTPQLGKSMADESLFIEEISRFVKLVKKKEMLYLRILEGNSLMKGSAEGESGWWKDFQSFLEQYREIESKLDEMKNEDFFYSKTYLYTVFMRIREVLENQARRFKADGRTDLCVQFEGAHRSLTELYGNLVYQERYDIMEIIGFINRNQNKRISQLMPKKQPATLEAMRRPNKLLEKLKSPSEGPLRKTISVELLKTKESKAENLISRKLMMSELVASSLLQKRKEKKSKGGLFRLYDILGLKSYPGDCCEQTREQWQRAMRERNKGMFQSLRQFEKRCMLQGYGGFR